MKQGTLGLHQLNNILHVPTPTSTIYETDMKEDCDALKLILTCEQTPVKLDYLSICFREVDSDIYFYMFKNW